MAASKRAKAPLISIAIPVYNGQAKIAAAVQSALQQQAPGFEWEVVVSDNHSSDETAAILDAIDSPRLSVTHWESTVNMWENHNRCLQQATGDYVLFCHADDVLLPHALITLGQRLALRGNPERYMAFGYSLFRDPLKRWTTFGLPLDTPVAGESACLPHTLGGICPSGALYSRQAMLERGGFYPCTIHGALSDMATGIGMALDGFTFEFVAGLWFRREAAGTHAGLTPDVARARVFDALDALAADVGMDALRKVATQTLELPIRHLTLLERYLVYAGALDAGHCQRLLVRRMSPTLVRTGDARALVSGALPVG